MAKKTNRSEEHVEGLPRLSHFHSDWLEFVLEPHLHYHILPQILSFLTHRRNDSSRVVVSDIFPVTECVLIRRGHCATDTLEDCGNDLKNNP